MKFTDRLDRTARSHDGVVTMREWMAAGNSRASWFRHQGGVLVPYGPGVARFAGAPATTKQQIRAAVLGTKNTVASHRSAAYLWGVDIDGADPVDLIATTVRFGPRLRNTVIHRPSDLADLRPVVRAGIPATNPMRTLLDLGAVAPDMVDVALEQMLIAGLVTVPGLGRMLASHRQRGRRGVGPLDKALKTLLLSEKPPDSVLEPAMARVFARVGIDGWIFHHYVVGIELDFGFPAQHVDVEVDGWASHAKRRQFERDRERDAELGAVGWLVLRFTWTQVTRRPSWVASTVLATLVSRSPDCQLPAGSL
jgi:Protein of unknown function (DUF559)